MKQQQTKKPPQKTHHANQPTNPKHNKKNPQTPMYISHTPQARIAKIYGFGLEETFTGPLVQTMLQGAGTPSRRPNCLEPHPI